MRKKILQRCTWGLILAALSMGVSPCDKSHVPIGSQDGCAYNGTIYDIGATFPDSDGCNTCSCTDASTGPVVSCSAMACLDACTLLNGQTCEGQWLACISQPGSDGCRESIRFADGEYAWQHPESLERGTYSCTTGDSWFQGLEMRGELSLTLEGNGSLRVHFGVDVAEFICPGTSGSCVDDGEVHPVGDTWSVPNGSCTCSEEVDGGPAVTCAGILPAACCSMADYPVGADEGAHCCADGNWVYDTGSGGNEECIPLGGPGEICQGDFCSYGGAYYGIGESFDAVDGCNTCTCTIDGETSAPGIFCTEMACTNGCIDADNDGWARSEGPDSCSHSFFDCNDTDSSVSPSAPELAANHVDDDCDGEVDENDSCGTDVCTSGEWCCAGMTGLSCIPDTAICNL